MSPYLCVHAILNQRGESSFRDTAFSGLLGIGGSERVDLGLVGSLQHGVRVGICGQMYDIHKRLGNSASEEI